MKRLYYIIAIIVIVIVGTFFVIKKKRTSSLPHQERQTVKVERGNLEVKVLSTGTIQPYTRVEVNSPLNGRIEEVEVNEGDKVKTGTVLALISSEDRIALLDAARSDLEQAKKSKDESIIKEAESAYEIADKSYRPISLTTSISGEVIKRSCEPGQNISTQSILFVISDKLVAGVEVDEADIGKIKLGQEAKIVLDAFPDEGVKGVVSKISRESRIVSNVTIYDVMVSPESTPPYWASGMTANVEFFIEGKENVLMIPRSAVKEQKGKKIVMVLENKPAQFGVQFGIRDKTVMALENKPSPREVELGISDGRMVEVISGLVEGEEIISKSEEVIPAKTGGPPRNIMRMMH